MKNKSGRSFGFPVFWSLLAIILLTAGSSAVFADFTPKTDLFSADKDTPLGFTNLVEPNVLLLIDTSSSMTERMSSGTSTYGDGTNPYNFGGSTTYYYFGTDQNSAAIQPATMTHQLITITTLCCAISRKRSFRAIRRTSLTMWLQKRENDGKIPGTEVFFLMAIG